MAVQTFFDYDPDLTLGDFLDVLSRWRGQIVGFRARGPAAGSPTVCVRFPSREQLDRYAQETGMDVLDANVQEVT